MLAQLLPLIIVLLVFIPAIVKGIKPKVCIVPIIVGSLLVVRCTTMLDILFTFIFNFILWYYICLALAVVAKKVSQKNKTMKLRKQEI